MDAAMISRYMTLVESSQTILPAFILEILDVILPTADTSVEVLKQAATLVKPRGGVGSLTNANALASGADLGGDEALGVLGGGLKGMVLVGRRTPLFACSAAVGWGTSPVAITGWDGVILCPTQHKLESPFMWAESLQRWWHQG